MANKDNFKPVPGERDDDFNKPKGIGTDTDKGMGRPEDLGRDRGTDDRDLDEDIRPTDKGR